MSYNRSRNQPGFYEARVKAIWHLRTIHEAFPQEARPSYVSPSAIEELNFLASACRNRNSAKEFMLQAREKRIQNGERSKASEIQVFDIRRATQLARNECVCTRK